MTSRSKAIYIYMPTNGMSRLAQLVERVTSNDEVSRSSRLMGISFYHKDMNHRTRFPVTTMINLFSHQTSNASHVEAE